MQGKKEREKRDRSNGAGHHGKEAEQETNYRRGKKGAKGGGAGQKQHRAGCEEEINRKEEAAMKRGGCGDQR